MIDMTESDSRALWTLRSICVALLITTSGCATHREPAKRDEIIQFQKLMLGAKCSNRAFSRCMGFESNRECEIAFEELIDNCVEDVDPNVPLSQADSLALSECYARSLTTEKLYIARQEVCTITSKGANEEPPADIATPVGFSTTLSKCHEAAARIQENVKIGMTEQQVRSLVG